MHLKAHKIVQQGCFFFQYSRATSTTGWAQIFHRFVILWMSGCTPSENTCLFDIYQMCPAPLMSCCRFDSTLINYIWTNCRATCMKSLTPKWTFKLSPKNTHKKHTPQNFPSPADCATSQPLQTLFPKKNLKVAKILPHIFIQTTVSGGWWWGYWRSFWELLGLSKLFCILPSGCLSCLRYMKQRLLFWSLENLTVLVIRISGWNYGRIVR